MESYHIIIDLQFHLFVDQSHKSHNAPALYPTKHQSEHKYAHFTRNFISLTLFSINVIFLCDTSNYNKYLVSTVDTDGLVL